MQQFRIFISYSSKDEKNVLLLVSLIRSIGVSVFRDKDSIPPGIKWLPEIEEAIGEAEIVLVFWSQNSLNSIWVVKEYEQAIDLGKRVIPVLLDSTPLPEKLKDYQSLDLSELWRFDSSTPPLIPFYETSTSIHLDARLDDDLKENFLDMAYTFKVALADLISRNNN